MNGTSQPIPPPPGAPPQTPKKGLGPLGWILIGCGGLILIAGLVFGGLMMAGGWFVKKQAEKFEKNPTLAAAEMMVRLNPDLELVSKDEEHSTLTIKNKKTGEVATFSAEDAKEGKFVFKTDQGTTVFDASGKDGGTVKVTTDKGEVATFGAGAPQNLPAWLPIYPGGTVQGTFDTTNAEGRSAAFTVTTTDPADKVLEYYETQFENAGLKVDKTTLASNDQTSGGTLTVKSDDDKRQASVIVSTSGEGTQAMISFQEKK
ncbi:MAG TPA: hypothetical protein VGG03_04000 [Thermoanaerobaculia bacterium]